MRSLLVVCALLLLSACALAQEGAPAAADAAAAAAAAKAAWPEELRAAFEFENADAWEGGEVVAEPRRSGEGAMRWANHVENTSLTLRPAPLDLSAFNTMSFWVHSSAANDATFMIIAESQREAGVFSYYSSKFKVDWTGWKQLSLRFREFGSAREPAGWQRISRLRFTASGWEQRTTADSVWVFDNLDFSYDPEAYRPRIRVEKYVEEPARTAFAEQLQAGHPRLILLDSELPRLRHFIANDPLGQQWYETVKAQAERLAARPVQTHRLPDGRRLLSISRDVLDRIYHWGLVYRLEGDRRWLDRAYEEMAAVAAFPDWNPSHWLDTAEMTHAMAIGYDWFYNDLSEAQREVVREAIWRHGLRLAYAAYLGLEAEGQQHWKSVTNNWNFVCNGGAALGAMALLDERPDECAEILHAAFQYIQIPLHHFEPDGAWWEGIGYWGYSMRYLLSYLRGLETAFGTDFGLIAALQDKGLSRAGDFPVYLTTPLGGIFNFADSGSGGSSYEHWGFLYLAARFNNPMYLQFQTERAKGSPEDLIYYEPVASQMNVEDMPLDKYFRETEVATLRGSWTDPNAVFLGVKAGRNGIAHAHQDLGSFIFYALGEKWVQDLGTEGQTYQSHKHHLPNWHFYRIRAEGHNTLVFNPRETRSQDPGAASTVTRFESTPDDAFAIVDLSDAYREYATSVTRGYRLYDQRRALLVQDEIVAEQANDLWWFAHGDTDTVWTLSADAREATAQRNDKVCRVYLQQPADARFELMDARPLPTSPDPDIQQQNEGIRKLAIHLPAARSTTVAVRFVPQFAFEPSPAAPALDQPLSDWRLGDAPPALTGLAIDGADLPDFTPQAFAYTVELPDEQATVPTVTATAAGDATVAIEPATALPGTTRVTVGEGGRSATYLVRFLHPTPTGGTDKPHVRAEPVKVGDITVTASLHDGNEPQNVLDNDPETRWSASGESEWLAFAFDQPRRIETVQIAWYNGDQRASAFDIEVSDDGLAWRKVFEGRSGGKSAALESYRLPEPATTRYLRIVGHGNSDNLWNSITEVGFGG